MGTAREREKRIYLSTHKPPASFHALYKSFVSFVVYGGPVDILHSSHKGGAGEGVIDGRKEKRREEKRGKKKRVGRVHTVRS